jgi:hypothetical protein
MADGFNIKLGIYIIAAIIIVGYGSYKVYEYYEGLGALLYFVGSLYVCIIYGTRWFGPDSSDKVTSWPPIINTCPDYLSYYQRTMTDGSKVNTCVDTIGIGSLVKKFDAANQSDDMFFSLDTTSGDKKTAMCNLAIAKKLTWEGITNGESCTFPTA